MEFGVVLAAIETEELPPWQSVQPRETVFVGCMVGSSVEVWHEMHPADLRLASSCDWPRTIDDGGSCKALAREEERREMNKDSAVTKRGQRIRSEERLSLRSGFMATRLRK